jgi:hypothetical protein
VYLVCSYVLLLPVGKAALVMSEFQKDFLCEGGFGAALGNNLSQLQVRACDAALCYMLFVMLLLLLWAVCTSSAWGCCVRHIRFVYLFCRWELARQRWS